MFSIYTFTGYTTLREEYSPGSSRYPRTSFDPQWRKLWNVRSAASIWYRDTGDTPLHPGTRPLERNTDARPGKLTPGQCSRKRKSHPGRGEKRPNTRPEEKDAGERKAGKTEGEGGDEEERNRMKY